MQFAESASRSLRRAASLFLKCHRSIPGHAIAVVRELESSLWATLGGKRAEIRQKRLFAGPVGSNFSLVVGGVSVYASPPLTLFPYSKAGDFSPAVPVASKGPFCFLFCTRITTCYLDRAATSTGRPLFRTRITTWWCSLSQASRSRWRPAQTGPSRAESASHSLRRALLTPQVNPGPRYLCGKRT